MITSSSNAKVKNIIALQKKSKERKDQGLFVVEGRKLVGEVPAGWISELYVSESYAAGLSDSWESHAAVETAKDADYRLRRDVESGELQAGIDREFCGIKCEVLSDELFAKVSDTRTPQGILALVKMPSYDFSDLMGTGRRETSSKLTPEAVSEEAVPEDARQQPLRISEEARRQPFRISEDAGHQPLLLILEDIQDPGNLGTILRTAEGAGVTGVIMSRGTADIYNPKVVRSTMGSIYRVPFVVADDLQEMISKLKDAGVKLYAAHLQGASDYDAFDYSGPTGFMIGNEANGLTDETALLADAHIRIPMCGQVESLNAAVSAALLSYEAARQRRHL